jgi:hypothetical protein
MIRRLLLTAFAAGSLAAAPGCRHNCCKPSTVPNPFLPPAPGGAATIPPVGVPTTPGSVPAFPPPAVAPRAGSIPPPDPLLGGPPSNFGPPATSSKPEVLFPDPVPSGGTSRSQSPGSRSLLGDPSGPVQSPEPPLAAKPAPATPGNGFPPPAASPAPAPSPAAQANRFPGLPGFVVVKDGVATGRTPTAEGFDLLKKSGYRTVVYLHAEGADLADLQSEATTRGLTFTPIEVAPTRLASAVDAFNRVVGTPASRPVYLCDDNGIRAGVLWYIHFRTAEVLNADAAAIRARPLGYTEDGDEMKTFHVAVQQYLATH